MREVIANLCLLAALFLYVAGHDWHLMAFLALFNLMASERDT